MRRMGLQMSAHASPKVTGDPCTREAGPPPLHILHLLFQDFSLQKEYKRETWIKKYQATKFPWG